MANPQKNMGHLRIPKEIAFVLVKFQLSGYAWRIVWAIWLKTWGWHKDMDWISYGQLSDMTDIPRPKACAEIKKLIELRIIKRDPNKKKLCIGFNSDTSEWVLPKKGAQQLVDKSDNCSLKREQVFPKSGTVSVPQIGTHKRYIKNTRQEIRKKPVENYDNSPVSIGQILKDFII